MTFAQSRQDYLGINFKYLITASHNSEDVNESGLGVDLEYTDMISPVISYSISLGFSCLPFSLDRSEIFSYPGVTNQVNFRSDETFYNFTFGFTMHYVFLLTEKFFRTPSPFLKRLFPYVGSGILSTFSYKSISYHYETTPPSFIDPEENSRMLPAAATIPFILGFHYQAGKALKLNMGIRYDLLLWNQFSEKYGYNNLLTAYFGIFYKVEELF